ncbi:PDC sensor domain-containing protein [Colwellia echini]|uniref:Cache domain-containing protein n=1 Tax=Colwellia echini TaxID=1982103 RepID=A0ABY3MXT9_9GAMM|nr:hypothetical protein [Colwellia echini]TYK66032.1 hypothetical protein CWS31_007115 [Colwellia echini]
MSLDEHLSKESAKESSLTENKKATQISAIKAPFRGTFLLAPLILLFTVVMAVYSAINYWTLRDNTFEAQQVSYLQDTVKATANIETFIATVESSAQRLASAISDSRLNKSDYQQALLTMLQKNSMFFGGGIAFLPEIIDGERRLYAPYFAKNTQLDDADSFVFMQIADSYDYTLAGNEWFEEALEQGSRWSKPYFDTELGNILMTTYSAVIYWPDTNGHPQPVGVVTIDISIDDLGKAVHSLKFGGEGYAEILTGEGVYIYSPNKAYVLDKHNVFNDKRWRESKNYEVLKNSIEVGEPSIVKVYDQHTKQYDWVSTSDLLGSNWRMIVNFSEREVTLRSVELRHCLMHLILWSVLSICTALLYKQVVAPKNAVISWPTSLLVALVLILGVCSTWWVTKNFNSGDELKGLAITNKGQAHAIEQEYSNRALAHLTEQVVFIPTGIYIESMKFTSHNDIRVIGSVWQKFDLIEHKHVKRGVIFPGGAGVEFSQPFIEQQGDIELVRWQFQASLRFSLEYDRYPMVKDDFAIGIFSKDTGGNVLLIPDVESFIYLAPTSLPGISPEVFLPGWNIDKSLFEFREWNHRTTFGKEVTVKYENLPELYFNIGLSKVFVPAFISHLTPLLIAGLIAFITMLISTHDKTRLKFMGTGIGFDIGISTSIFFVVALSHIGLRERVVSDSIFYLELFYLLMYVNLISVCVHSILSGLNQQLLTKITFGIAAKKAFFPLNMFVVFIFSWLTFYT